MVLFWSVLCMGCHFGSQWSLLVLFKGVKRVSPSQATGVSQWEMVRYPLTALTSLKGSGRETLRPDGARNILGPQGQKAFLSRAVCDWVS